MRRKRLMLIGALALAVPTLVALVPLPHRVTATLLVQPREAQHVYVDTPGYLRAVAVQPGERVAPGQTLAVLDDPEAELRLAETTGRARQLEKQLQNLNRRVLDDPTSASLIPAVSEALVVSVEQRQQLLADRQRLTLRARREGVVFPPPAIAATPASAHELPQLEGTPLAAKNVGAWLPRGMLCCLIGETEGLEAVLVIDQGDIDFVERGQKVRLRFDEHPFDVWQGTIDDVAMVDLGIAPRELSSRAGGDLLTEVDASGHDRPANSAYQAVVRLSNVDGRLAPGFRGEARISVGSRIVASRLWRFFSQTLRF